MAAVHVLVDGGAALPAGAAAGYGLTQVAHHLQVGPSRFHAGTADPADLAAALTDPRMAVLPATAEELCEAYGGAAAQGIALLSLHGPAGLRGLASAAPSAALSAGLAASDLAVVELPLLGPGLGLVALHAAEAAQDPIPLGELATGARELAAGLVSEWIAPAAAGTLARCQDLGLLSWPGAGLEADASTTDPGSVLRYRLVVHPREGQLGMELRGRHADLGAAMRALADQVLRDGRAGGRLHLAGASAGAEPEIAALATYLDAQLGLAEVWLAQADPVSAYLGGPGSFGLAWYRE